MYKCNQCDRTYKLKDSLTRHIKQKHQNNRHHSCDYCNSTFNQEYLLQRHIKEVHEGGTPCNICGVTFNYEGSLLHHLKIEHDQEQSLECQACSTTLTTTSAYYRHIRNIHDGEFKCTDCPITYKKEWQLNNHKKKIHDKITLFQCTECDKEFTRKDSVDHHVKTVHTENRVFPCDQCDEAFKRKDTLLDHKKYIHTHSEYRPFQCTECVSKFKSISSLNEHLNNVHDIGKHECDYCARNRNSSIEHEGSKICRECYKKATGKTSRIEKIWSDYIDEKIGTEYLSGSDDSLKSMGGCQKYRPDKLYIGVNSVHLYECDEYQHKHTNGDYTCDEKRISDIYDEKGISGKNLIVVRWNPHSYKTKKKQHTQQQRLDKMIETINTIKNNPPKDKIHIYYLYYDKDNPRIAKNIPYTFII